MNSIRFAGLAIEYEIERQMEILEDGGTIIQETRLFDSSKNETRSMRSKEHAQDYRYFPDPDLPPLVLTDEEIEKVRSTLPELPDAKKTRFMSQYKLPSYDADLLCMETESAVFYENAVKALKSNKEGGPKILANWMLVELFGVLNKQGVDLSKSPVSAEALAELVNLILEDVISGKIAKDVFAIMIEASDSPSKIVEEKGLKQVTDTGSIEKIIDQVLLENPGMVEEYRSGKDKLFGFFVGQVMKLMAGKGNPGVINNILKKKLQG